MEKRSHPSTKRLSPHILSLTCFLHIKTCHFSKIWKKPAIIIIDLLLYSYMNKNNKKGVYIDLFSGCGGFSLGLGNAGWQGIFAVEKDEMAFETFKHNLIDGNYKHFDWPKWLPQKATTIQTLLKNYKVELTSLSGKVDLIAGGPPCQGFSLAGRRDPNDQRNNLSNQYIKMVKLISPKYIVLENVRGFNATFKDAKGQKGKTPY